MNTKTRQQIEQVITNYDNADTTRAFVVNGILRMFSSTMETTLRNASNSSVIAGVAIFNDYPKHFELLIAAWKLIKATSGDRLRVHARRLNVPVAKLEATIIDRLGVAYAYCVTIPDIVLALEDNGIVVHDLCTYYGIERGSIAMSSALDTDQIEHLIKILDLDQIGKDLRP